MRGGKGPGEGQSERQKIRIGQLGKGVGGALGQLINQGLPAVALSPKKTNKQNQQKPARRGLGRRMSQTHLQRKSSWRESLKIPSRDPGGVCLLNAFQLLQEEECFWVNLPGCWGLFSTPGCPEKGPRRKEPPPLSRGAAPNPAGASGSARVRTILLSLGYWEGGVGGWAKER